MQTQNHIAFKEWASIVDVLGRGEQVLILRKGGIHEKGLPAGKQGRKFDVAYSEFFLFPTFEHQNPADLKGLSIPANPGFLPVQYYCVVEDSFWIAEEKVLERLEPFHFWSRECLKKRFEWGEEKGLFGIIVRVYSFLEPIPLENLKRYGGCRSWVELERPLETKSLKPILSDEVFKKKKEKIREIHLAVGARFIGPSP